MDQATLKFLRELLPIDDQDTPWITSDGAIIRIAWCAIGVNLGSIPTTEAWLDRATIEQASKFFRSYEVRTERNFVTQVDCRQTDLIVGHRRRACSA